MRFPILPSYSSTEYRKVYFEGFTNYQCESVYKHTLCIIPLSLTPKFESNKWLVTYSLHRLNLMGLNNLLYSYH